MVVEGEICGHMKETCTRMVEEVRGMEVVGTCKRKEGEVMEMEEEEICRHM